MSPNVPLDTVAVIGLGYIGLPTAAVLAQAGRTVIGVDIKQSNVDAINAGKVPFVEEGLETVVAGCVAQGKLSAQIETPDADAYIVSVPTPFKGDHDADLSYIEAAAKGIAPKLSGGELVVLESTSPPGATEFMADVILGIRPEFTKEPNLPNSLYFSHAPERVLPGRIMIEMVENDRIIGGLSQEAGELNRDLYASFCRGELLVTDARTAEMAKLTENAFRDVNIAFANELSIIAERQGIDVWELIELANHHPRVNILQPGPGVGGHCIAVDPWFIVDAAPEEARLIRTAREVNDAKPHTVVEKVRRSVEETGADTVAAFGLAFKADIDDLRESPARFIVGRLAETMPETTILVVEPNIDELPEELAARSNVCLVGVEEATKHGGVGVLLVDHEAFRKTGLNGRFSSMIDTKGVLR